MGLAAEDVRLSPNLPPTIRLMFSRLQAEVLAEAVAAFEGDFKEALRRAATLEGEVATFFGYQGRGGGGAAGAGGGGSGGDDAGEIECWYFWKD